MLLVSDEYREQLKLLHRKWESFGSGSKYRGEFIGSLGYKDILDYGCGKGRLGTNKKYDPALPEFSEEPEPADLVVCTDVLEHIEPECLDNVLRHIRSKMLKAGYFTIGCSPAAKKLSDGRNAHLIIRPPEWWVEKLSDYFVVVLTSTHNDERKIKKNKPPSVELEVHLKPK